MNSVFSAGRKQFTLFILVGGFAAAVNFFSRIVLSHWLSYVAAIVIAYLIGMATAFVLNKRFVFSKAATKLHQQLVWFIAVNIAAIVQTVGVSLLLAEMLFPRIGFSWHNETVAHAFGVAVPVLTSYLGHKKLSFKGG